ncbi:unnamed protein product [Didymodactylos carnosus]|uniref:Uncharacterized protein n=1 Tax=Didymodactylos carnosus TaxID=1234261 RepID=A0A814Z4N9_9BILA|nr:unnamed protein product [Didymodactylos carnosus]CAF1236968.1 unnamed protein product [Didymodactylos carnosus]CAF3890122.1 unnamed protein product [Didymodactylos carnosus]CAF3999324.1 unnamed protein product [Didymodactylos carnosus]
MKRRISLVTTSLVLILVLLNKEIKCQDDTTGAADTYVSSTAPPESSTTAPAAEDSSYSSTTAPAAEESSYSSTALPETTATGKVTTGKGKGGKTTYGKTTYGKTTGGKTTYGKTTYRKTTYGKTTGGKATYGKTTGGKTTYGKVTTGKVTTVTYPVDVYTNNRVQRVQRSEKPTTRRKAYNPPSKGRYDDRDRDTYRSRDRDADRSRDRYTDRSRGRAQSDDRYIDIYVREPERHRRNRKQRQTYTQVRFPARRYRGSSFPYRRPFISYVPWLPIYADPLTRQTIIYSPTGGMYIIPPLVNFYGQIFSVAELIAWGYASLVSSGAPPPPNVNVAPLIQPAPPGGVVPGVVGAAGGVVGGGVVGGGVVGGGVAAGGVGGGAVAGVRTNFGTFQQKYPRGYDLYDNPQREPERSDRPLYPDVMSDGGNRRIQTGASYNYYSQGQQRPQSQVNYGNSGNSQPRYPSQVILLVFCIISTNGLECYDCACPSNTICPCDKTESIEGNNTYCVIVREHIGENIDITLEHIPRNLTKFYVKNPYYISVRESISYDDVIPEWKTDTLKVIYGCNWDLCNKPDLVPLLPSSFSLSLPDEWLNNFILGSDPTMCHECPDGPSCGDTDFFDISRCPEKACNGTCILSDLFEHPDSDPLEFCYQSFCYESASDIEFDIDTHRIEIDGIYYLDTEEFAIWEIDVYCRADDCSRPEIFSEIRENLRKNINVNEFLHLRPAGVLCYSCEQCVDTTTCECTNVEFKEGTHCTIKREKLGDTTYITLEHLDRNSSKNYIKNPYYLSVRESIIYDVKTLEWSNKPDLIVFGCNWNYCNKPDLVSILPDSFFLTLPDDWLNTFVLGTNPGSCHECPLIAACGNTDFIDTSRCPEKACNETCVMREVFVNLDDFCYTSGCYYDISTPIFDVDTHRIEIDGVYHLDTQEFEIWEMDVFCRADDCSRPELFNDIRSKLQKTISADALLNLRPDGIWCYNCECTNSTTCPCNETLFKEGKDSYCTIVREHIRENIYITLEHIPRNSTKFYVKNPYYISVRESIKYIEESSDWITDPDVITYGCNWNYCNKPDLVPLLPSSFSLSLPDEWLNNFVLGSDPTMCHECPDGPSCGDTDFFDISRCPEKACNGTCILNDLFEHPDSDPLEFCYQSLCYEGESTPNFDIDTHRIEIDGICYLDTREFNIWEIDIFCRADDCSRPEIFDEIRSNLSKVIVVDPFLNLQPNTTTTTRAIPPSQSSTIAPGTISSTIQGSTTTPRATLPTTQGSVTTPPTTQGATTAPRTSASGGIITIPSMTTITNSGTMYIYGYVTLINILWLFLIVI